MSSSPSRGSPRRGAGSPSKSTSVNPSASQATLTPRRPAGQRVAGAETHVSPATGSRLATSLALAAQDTLLTASTASPPGTATGRQPGRAGTEGVGGESGNPHVRAIQSRVAELVRRYDESMDSGAVDDDDEDSNRLDVPTRWRVGDLLLTTHSALAKTSTRTERSMMSEFAEDVEVSSAIGEGEHSFSLVLEQAAQKAEQMKAVLNKTLQVVKQLQLNDEADEADKDAAAAGSHQKLRELKITVDALHKEKSMVLAQLHEHVKSHKEMAAMMEEQTQELRKAQIAITCKHDELKSAREDFAFRLNDLQKMNETSQQTISMWRDKYQSSLKTLGEAEQRVTELEQRVQAEAAEVTKHDFILRAKNSELEKFKERLKDSEAARLRAETAQREAAAAAAESAAEAAAANKRAEAAATKAKASTGDTQSKLPNKDRQELEAKIRQHEGTIRDLQRRLSELTETRTKFEDDNNELARIVRELQSKAHELMNAKPPAAAPAPSAPPRTASLQRSTSFSLSLRSSSSQKKKRSSSSQGGRRGSQVQAPGDDLSTDSEDDDDDSEAERDERELNDTLLQVVTSVFPQRVSLMEDKSDETLNERIAQYEEDPTGHAIVGGEVTVIEDDATTVRRLTATLAAAPRPGSRGTQATPATTSTGDAASTSELAQLQQSHLEQIARLKKQYVTGLLEYKKLIIEQYERRQSEIQQHHRMEIENLILVVQEKFKRELERRGERVLQAKESLKLLYRAMQINGDGSGGGDGDGSASTSRRRRSGLGVFDEDDENGADDDDGEDEPVPLKSILRAAVFAMSSSKGRNKQASDDISKLYDDLRTKKNTPRKPKVKIVVKHDVTPPPQAPEEVEAPVPKRDTDWAAFLQSMRANRDASSKDPNGKNGRAVSVHVACQVDERDFVIFELKGLRGNHAAPENMDGYVLPSAALLEGTTTKRRVLRGHAGGSLDGVLYLNEGALLSDDVVAELRGVLPFLPPGSYFLSSALRHQMLLAMLRFYAELGRRHAAGKQAPLPSPSPSLSPREPVVEIVLGSPRDTPFLRRKAVESTERRQRLSNGALAVLQPAAATSTSSSTSGGFVSAAAMATSALSHVRHGHRSSR